ncbi:hypothetical protein ACJMK2_020053 [Sinanodonta woodiana]|uniref:Uncharacterized protein n=1 Tax=Sinanodonta woodiana TaxID=1069815 RepID=A0ABD3TYS9_SINWO
MMLQSEEFMVHKVQTLLWSLLNDLYSCFIRPDVILNHAVEEVCIIDQQMEDEDFLIGGEARYFLGRKRISAAKKQNNRLLFLSEGLLCSDEKLSFGEACTSLRSLIRTCLLEKLVPH